MFEAFEGLKAKRKQKRYEAKMKANEAGATGGGPLGEKIRIAIADDEVKEIERTPWQVQVDYFVDKARCYRDNSR